MKPTWATEYVKVGAFVPPGMPSPGAVGRGVGFGAGMLSAPAGLLAGTAAGGIVGAYENDKDRLSGGLEGAMLGAPIGLGAAGAIGLGTGLGAKRLYEGALERAGATKTYHPPPGTRVVDVSAVR
jgi:hypothetical protein